MQNTESKSVRIDRQHCQEILTEMKVHPDSSLAQAFFYLWKGLLKSPSQRFLCIRSAHDLLAKWLENNGGVQ